MLAFLLGFLGAFLGGLVVQLVRPGLGEREVTRIARREVAQHLRAVPHRRAG